MHEIQDASVHLRGPEAHCPTAQLAAALTWRAGDDAKAGKTEGTGSSSGKTKPADERREKTIAEAFEDLDAEEKQTVSRLLDRMTGRKQ